MSRLVLPLTTQYSTSASRIVSLKTRVISSTTAASDTSRITTSQSSSAVRCCKVSTSCRPSWSTVSGRGSPAAVLEWLRRHLADAQRQIEPPRLTAELGARRLTFRLHQQIGSEDEAGDWLIVMREVSDSAVIEAMSLSFKLTAREAEVLYWVVKGKINRDIADILGASPATVKKHLERIFAKLGVETRTAAAGMAMNRIRQLHPQFEG